VVRRPPLRRRRRRWLGRLLWLLFVLGLLGVAGYVANYFLQHGQLPFLPPRRSP
jgi:hypothetical protein